MLQGYLYFRLPPAAYWMLAAALAATLDGKRGCRALRVARMQRLLRMRAGGIRALPDLLG
jgi:hypothetical protein